MFRLKVQILSSTEKPSQFLMGPRCDRTGVFSRIIRPAGRRLGVEKVAWRCGLAHRTRVRGPEPCSFCRAWGRAVLSSGCSGKTFAGHGRH